MTHLCNYLQNYHQHAKCLSNINMLDSRLLFILCNVYIRSMYVLFIKNIIKDILVTYQIVLKENIINYSSYRMKVKAL